MHLLKLITPFKIIFFFVFYLIRIDAFQQSISIWNPFEITLISQGVYSNPYIHVDLNATFKLENISLIVPGFWDGSNTWKIRFSPHKIGSWSFLTSCNMVNDGGLHRQSGSFVAIPTNDSRSIYQHGFLIPSESKRFLQHMDGTPFYWLGNTDWSGFSDAEAWDASIDPKYRSMFKAIAQVRASQGYTVWKAETFAVNANEHGNSPKNEGGSAWNTTEYINLNPLFWQAIDKRINYINKQGLVVSFALGIGRGMPDQKTEQDVKRLARYTVARYSAYHVVWITCQEYCTKTSCPDCWARVAEKIYMLDPHKRATSLHNCINNPIRYHNESWYGFVTLQQGHNRVSSYKNWLNQYNANPPRPVLEDEANYEQIIREYGGGAEWKTRQSAWQSQVSGSFGFTYGGQGIWWGCASPSYENFNCGPVGSDEYRIWNETLKFPVGGIQLSHMAKFFTSLPWWTLEPDFSAITWTNQITFPYTVQDDTQRPFQKANSNRDIIVAYLPQSLRPSICGGNTTLFRGVVQSLNISACYHIQWFDPIKGTYIFIANITGVTSWTIPPPPLSNSIDDIATKGQDWVFLLKMVKSVSSLCSNSAVQKNKPEMMALDSSFILHINSLGRQRGGATTTGMEIMIASKRVCVTHLGRMLLAGNVGVQQLFIVNSTGYIIANAKIDTSSSATDFLGFQYGSITSPPVILESNSIYYIVDQQDANDCWCDDIQTAVITNNSVGSILASVYGTCNHKTNNDGVKPDCTFSQGGGGKGHSYGPLNFKYTECNTGEL